MSYSSCASVTTNQNITLDDAESLFRNRLGLIFGPGIAFDGNYFSDLSKRIADHWSGDPRQNYIVNAQQALATGANIEQIKKEVRIICDSPAPPESAADCGFKMDRRTFVNIRFNF